MNSKRSRSKLYRLIDTFFILAPIFVFLLYSLGSVFVIAYSSYQTGSFNSIGDFLSHFNFSIISEEVSNFLYFSCLDEFSSGFVINIYSFVDNCLFFFIEYSNDPHFILFLEYYFTYVIMYELFSLFLNVIMWLPRYFRNWVQEKTDTMI